MTSCRIETLLKPSTSERCLLSSRYRCYYLWIVNISNGFEGL